MPDVVELLDTFDILGAEGDSCIECFSGDVSGGSIVLGLLCMEHSNYYKFTKY